MAKVVPLPADLPPPPDFDPNEPFEEFENREDEWVAGVVERARQQSSAPETGEAIDFPVADGYARYLVWEADPLTLVHLPLGDRWRIEPAHERGLEMEDIREKIKQRQARDRLFSAPKSWPPRPGP